MIILSVFLEDRRPYLHFGGNASALAAFRNKNKYTEQLDTLIQQLSLSQ